MSNNDFYGRAGGRATCTPRGGGLTYMLSGLMLGVKKFSILKNIFII